MPLIDEYIICVHIFRNVDLPCCANWVLKRTAIDKLKFSLRAIEAVLEHFYMDDYLDSFLDLEEAIKVIVELTKFVSNKVCFNYMFKVNNKNTRIRCEDLDETAIEGALGVLWDPKQVVLKIKTINKEVPNAKRDILSFVIQYLTC